MAQLKLRSIGSTRLKWILAAILLVPLIGYGAVNKFDLLKANRADVDNIRLDGNTVSSTNTNGDIVLNPNGTGGVQFPDLTVTRVPYIDANGEIAVSSVTPTELGYLSGVTSSLCGISQSCTLTNKTITAPAISDPTFSGTITTPLTASRALVTGASSELSASAVTSTELGYVSGVTSSLCGISQSCTLTNKVLTGNTAVNLISGSGTMTLNTSGTVTLPNATDTLVGKATTDTLTNKTLTAPTIDVVSFDDQGSTPSTPASGLYKLYFKTDGSLYSLNPSGVEAAVGSSGAGGTNEQREYISNGTFELATTGWSTYGDAASSSPADGTGGSPSITFTRTTTSGEALKSTASGELSKSAADEQGEGISYDFTVDYENHTSMRPVYVSFDYQTTANYASGDIKVFVYDKDAAALLTVVDADNLSGALPASTTPRRWTGAFYPSTSTSNDYRLIFHITSTNATAYDMHIDSVHAGSQVTTPSAIITDWTSYTPTGSWVSNATYTGKWRRVGDSMEAVVQVATSGAPTSAALTINLPSGYTIDTNKLVAASSTIGSLGDGTAADASVQTYPVIVEYSSTTAVAVYAIQASGTYDTHGSTPLAHNLPFTFGASDLVEINFKVPISNWTSGASLSTTEFLQSSAVAQGTGDPASVASGNIIIFPSENFDNTGSYNTSTGQFTAPKTGRYRVHGAIISANAGIGLFVYPNGSGASAIQVGTTDSNGEATFSGTIYASKGTTLDLRPNGTLDAVSNSLLNFEYIPDFSIFTQVPDTSDRIVRARIVYSAGTPSVNASSPSNWISSLTDNGTAGDTTLNLTSGIFSGTPTCTCTVENPATANMRGCKLYSLSTSAIRTITTDMSSTGADEIYNIICIGAR